MEAKANKLRNKKGKFNIVDVLVIITVCCFIFSTFAVFDPFDWFSGFERRDVTISYVVELKGLDEDMVANIKVGDNVLNSATEESIGRIFDVDLSSSYEWKALEGQSEMVKVLLSGKWDVRLKIDIPCVFEEGVGYIVNGQQVAVGTLVNIKLPSFVGSGYCISITEME